MKKLLLVAAGLAALLLVSLGLFAACVVHAGRHFNFSFDFDEKATREETRPIEIQSGEALHVDLGGGAVRVRAGEGAPSLAAKITAWGSSREEADAALARAKLDIAKTPDGLRVTLADATTEKEIAGGHVRITAEADLEIRVPEGVRLEIRDGSGDVQAEGPFADSNVHSSYGDVRIAKVAGNLEATSDSGHVEVSGVRGKKLLARSSYGEVDVVDCESGEIEVKSDSGEVRLEDVRGDHLRVGSAYGDLVLSRIRGEVEAELSSGDVRATEWSGPRASLATSYGSVEVENATGNLRASSSSGDVRVDKFQGVLEARSSYGAIHVEGVFSGLVADTSSGDVTVRALPGSQVAERWRISSAYGTAKLTVPEGFACDLDARTGYGEVDLGLPIEKKTGALEKEGKSVRGKVNGGGGEVEIRCQSGDVIVETAGS